jgi:hypothetical protein
MFVTSLRLVSEELLLMEVLKSEGSFQYGGGGKRLGWSYIKLPLRLIKHNSIAQSI